MVDIEFKEEEGQDFEKLLEEKKDTPTFVDFNATWCGPCRALKPQLKKICEDNKFNFISVDVDENPELSEKYGVQGIPYVTVYAPLANDDDAKTMIFMGISVGHIKEISNKFHETNDKARTIKVKSKTTAIGKIPLSLVGSTFSGINIPFTKWSLS